MDDILDIDHLLCGIQESFVEPTPPEKFPHQPIVPHSLPKNHNIPPDLTKSQVRKKNLQLSTTQDIDLIIDEIFSDIDDNVMPPGPDHQIAGPSTRHQIEKPRKVSTQTMNKLNMFRYDQGRPTTDQKSKPIENMHTEEECVEHKEQSQPVITGVELKKIVMGTEEDVDLDCLELDF